MSLWQIAGVWGALAVLAWLLIKGAGDASDDDDDN